MNQTQPKIIQFPIPIRDNKSENSQRNRLNFNRIIQGKTNPFFPNNIQPKPSQLKPTHLYIKKPTIPKKIFSIEQTGNFFSLHRGKIHQEEIKDLNNTLLKSPLIDSTSVESYQKAMRSLIDLILSILEGSPVIRNDLPTSHFLLNILREVLAKKFKNINLRKAFPDNVDKNFLDFYVSKINKALNKNFSRKRSEENNKFIFKTIMAVLRKEFFQENGLEESGDNEILFYKYFFEDLSIKNKNNLNSYFDPLYRTSLKNEEFKSINNNYLVLIFSSNCLKGKFINYLEERFLEDYKRISVEKVYGVMRPLLKKLEEKSNSTQLEVVFEAFTSKLRRSKKCKLPWSSVEVQKALNQFKKFLR